MINVPLNIEVSRRQILPHRTDNKYASLFFSLVVYVLFTLTLNQPGADGNPVRSGIVKNNARHLSTRERKYKRIISVPFSCKYTEVRSFGAGYRALPEEAYKCEERETYVAS